MCDCCEAAQQACIKCCGPHEEDAEPPPDHTKAILYALAALLCSFLVYLLYSLDRRTIRKILTMLGLGFLFAQPSQTKPAPTSQKKPCMPRPNPCLPRPPEPTPTCQSSNKPAPPPDKTCHCRDKKPAAVVPPSQPPSCKT